MGCRTKWKSYGTGLPTDDEEQQQEEKHYTKGLFPFSLESQGLPTPPKVVVINHLYFFLTGMSPHQYLIDINKRVLKRF